MQTRFSSQDLVVDSSLVREKINRRTRELAVLAGRIPPQVSQVDYEQAKRDIIGDDPQEPPTRP